MPVPPSPSRDELLALVPPGAIRSRSRPYHGDPVAAPIAALGPGDAAIVRRLYDLLGALYHADTVSSVREVLAAHDLHARIDEIRRLGLARAAEVDAELLHKVYHDLRGGSLTALLMLLDRVDAGRAEQSDIEQVFILVRDQRKIMRNVLPDLDPEGYARDLAPREHDAALLVHKWSDAAYRIDQAGAVRICFDCAFVGGVAECCMEFAALDRVLYNLINNAARFAVDGLVDVAVFPLSDAPETDLRFAVSNRVTPAQRDRLLADIGADLSRVFAGGYTTGGHGYGLQICGDFITHGYGLDSPRQALEGGYLGARILRDHFIAWFHWPARRAA